MSLVEIQASITPAGTALSNNAPSHYTAAIDVRVDVTGATAADIGSMLLRSASTNPRNIP
jgi:hypothetical protein